MSFELTQLVIRHAYDIKPLDKLVLAVIVDKIDGKGYCYPSLVGLQKITGLSKNAVLEALGHLINKGIITKKKHAGGNNRYHFHKLELKKCLMKPSLPKFADDLASSLEELPVVQEKVLVVHDENPYYSLSSTQVNKGVTKEVNNASKQSLASDQLMLHPSLSKKFVEQLNTPLPWMASFISNIKSSMEVPSNMLLLKYPDGTPMKVEDLDAMIAKDDFGLKKSKTASATGIWHTACKQLAMDTDQPVPKMPADQSKRGMLNKAQKKLGDMYDTYVWCCITLWPNFVNFTNDLTGTTNIPSQPSIMYFVGHLDEVVKFCEYTETKAKKKEKPKVTKLVITKKVLQKGKTAALLKASKEKKDGS